LTRGLALGLLLLTAFSCHAGDVSDPLPATISVSGEGLVMASPDMVSVTVGVVSQAQDAAGALAANNSAMKALNNVLDNFEVADRDRRTSNFNISPRYDRRSNDGRAPEISSYEVNNQVTIRYRDIERVGELLDAVVGSGGNRINGLVFGNSDDTGLLDEARRLAIADAQRKAALYAESAGGKAGNVLSISEAGAPQPRPMLRGAVAMAEAASVPISAGENEFRATVNVVFELE
jgi:uncharacterized protein YggE